MTKIPLIFGGIEDCAVMNEPGTVEQNIRIGLPDAGNDGIMVHHVKNGGRYAMVPGQTGKRAFIDVGGVDFGTLCRHRQCGGPANALARRRNQRPLSGKSS